MLFVLYMPYNFFGFLFLYYCLLLCLVDFFCSETLVTPWTVARQAPLSMEFPRQEYWSGLTFPPPGDLPDPGIEPTSLVSADAIS